MPPHTRSKTAGFVVRRFGDITFSAELVETRHGYEYRALCVSRVSGLEHVEGLAEVVVFIDCGEEEIILAEIAEARMPPVKLSFFLCDTSIAPVLRKFSEMQKHIVFSPFASGEPDAVMHAFQMSLTHFHKSGETHPPDYPVANA
jgi:hypothetical protein